MRVTVPVPPDFRVSDEGDALTEKSGVPVTVMSFTVEMLPRNIPLAAYCAVTE